MSFRYFEVAGHAATYNKFRHSPPQQLITKIVDYIKEKVASPLHTAVDVGCGGGQSTLVLYPHFQTVIGLDPSRTQVEDARRRNNIPNVSFRVGEAEKMDLADSSVQLVVASQACHWFHLPTFYAEAERVLEHSGVLAMYCYRLPQPQYGRTLLGDIVEKYYKVVLSDYILPQSKRAYLSNYTDEEFNKIPFIKEPLTRDESTYVEFPGTVTDLVGYASSWSGFQNCRKHEGDEKSNQILKNFESEIMDAVGCQSAPGEIKLSIKFQYFLLMGRKPSKK